MLSRILGVLGLILLVATSSCQEDTSRDPVILRLGAQQVHRSEFDLHVTQLARRAEDEVTPELRKALLDAFVEQRILVLEARARGLVKPGERPEAEKAAVEMLLSRVLAGIEVTEAELLQQYESHRESYRVAASVTVRQILVPTENEARDVRRRLQRDPKSFEILARSRSRSPEASTGGLMGTFEPGQLPAELETPAFALPVGATGDVVPSPLGYHVLRVDARTAARELPLEECRAAIRAQLIRDKSESATRSFIDGLLAKAKVNHEAALRSSQQS